MYCRNCGKQMAEGAAMYIRCGFSKGQGNRFCHHCGQPTQERQAVCTSYGLVLNGPNRSFMGSGVSNNTGFQSTGLVQTNENKVFDGVC